MAAADRDIIYPKVTLVATAEFEDRLRARRPDDVNNPRGVLLLTETLEDHVVAGWLLVLHKVVVLALSLHHQWVGRFANLALEGLPEVGRPIGLKLRLLARLRPGR